jgi:hypothetical protein
MQEVFKKKKISLSTFIFFLFKLENKIIYLIILFFMVHLGFLLPFLYFQVF